MGQSDPQQHIRIGTSGDLGKATCSASHWSWARTLKLTNQLQKFSGNLSRCELSGSPHLASSLWQLCAVPAGFSSGWKPRAWLSIISTAQGTQQWRGGLLSECWFVDFSYNSIFQTIPSCLISCCGRGTLGTLCLVLSCSGAHLCPLEVLQGLVQGDFWAQSWVGIIFWASHLGWQMWRTAKPSTCHCQACFT